MNKILRIIAEDKDIIPYRKTLRPICGGSITATILFSQILYWWNKVGCRPFYKYITPPEQKENETIEEYLKRVPTYRIGDSWTEELGFSKKEFNTALSKIAHKKSKSVSGDKLVKCPIKQYIQYWTDIQRITYYEVLKEDELGELIGSLFVSAPRALIKGLREDFEYNRDYKQRLQTEIQQEEVKPPLVQDGLALKESEEISEEDKSILKEWNDINLSGLTKHRSVLSKASPTKSMRHDPPTILSVIKNTMQEFSLEEIIDGIHNYKKTLKNPDIYYDYKFPNLSAFLYSDKGLKKFASNSVKSGKIDSEKTTDVFRYARVSKDYLSLKYDKNTPLNTENNTYMGVVKDVIINRDVDATYEDVKRHVRKGDFNYGHFCWIEECIACLTYRKENAFLLRELIDIHNEFFKSFKKEVENV